MTSSSTRSVMVWLTVIRLAAVTVVASFTTRVAGRRLFTPKGIVISAIGLANVIFALDSTPATFGLTQDPYIVSTANALALMGLRQLYLLSGGLLERIIHLNIGLSVILAFTGFKLIIEALHGSNVDAIGPIHLPETGIAALAGFVIVTIAVTTVSSLGKSSYHRRQLQASPVRSGRTGARQRPADGRGRHLNTRANDRRIRIGPFGHDRPSADGSLVLLSVPLPKRCAIMGYPYGGVAT